MNKKNTKLHHQTTQKLFYEQLKRFVFLIFLIPLTPVIIVKGFFFFYPDADVNVVINTLIFIYFCLVIVTISIYAMMQHSSIQKGLKPVSDLASFGDLAAKVAHDVRSPLSGIHMVSKSLQRISHQDPQLAKFSELLEMSSRRLEGIAEDLLSLHGARHIEKTPVDFHQLLDALIFELSSQQTYFRIKFHKQYCKLPLIFPIYEHQILRVFQNLFKNAAEAMRLAGSITVRTEVNDAFAVISVIDSGPGLSDQKIQKVLAGPYTEGKSDGHGLGLSYVREVLEHHRGQLSIESTPGRGACFQIKLPLNEQRPLEQVPVLSSHHLQS